jgi:Mg2+ and Co2+ transporter CorA
VGYVASLIVERKVMGQLSKKVLTQTLIEDAKEKLIEDIAGERPEDAKKRKDIERDLHTMRDVLKTMEEYLNASHDIEH